MKNKINEIINILDLLEEDIFHNDIGELCGKTYTRDEWIKYKQTLKKILSNLNKQKKASTKYLNKNKEYNRKMRLISYYRNKQNKTEQDYLQIEKLRKELGQYLEYKEEKKEQKKQKQLKEMNDALIKYNDYKERGV